MRLAWARGVLLTIAALFLFPACTFAQRAPVTTDENWTAYVIDGEIPAGANAITTCHKGRVVVVIPDFREKSPLEMQELWAHERVHVEQFSRYEGLSCEQVMALISSSARSLLKDEAEAYCAHAHWVMKQFPTVDPIPVLLGAAGGVARAYAQIPDKTWHVSYVKIAAQFLRACPAALTWGTR